MMQNSYKLDKLSQYFADDKSQIKEMINIFLNTIPPEIEQLKTNAEKEDWFELLKITHRIKPSIDVFDMKHILKDIKTIEKIARKKNNEGNLNNYIQELLKKFNKVYKSLHLELDKL